MVSELVGRKTGSVRYGVYSLSMLTTDQKGAVSEMAIAHAALELGIGVSRPLGDQRYDLIFDFRGRPATAPSSGAAISGPSRMSRREEQFTCASRGLETIRSSAFTGQRNTSSALH
jgi:hypothetical protein